MSLLLQALQKAAQSRENGESDNTADPEPGAELSLEPLREPEIPRGAVTAPESAPAPGPSRAATVMRATETPSYTPVDWMRDHYMLTFVGAAILFAIGYGTYVYIQVANPSFLRRAAPPARAPVLSVAAPAPPAADNTAKISGIPDEMSSLRGATPAVAAEKPAVAALAPAKESPAPNTAVPAPKPSTATTPTRPITRRAPSAAAAPAAVATERPAAPAATDEDGIEVVEIPASPTIAPASTPKPAREEISVRQQASALRPVSGTLLAAYEALQQGDYAKSRALYAKLLADEPRNIDALLGIAAIAWKQGRIDEATYHYSRVLDLDPRNTHAQAGLIAMLGSADPLAAETRLKQLIAREPSGFLYFTLGNLYADQGQWPSAQQAYFQAYQFQPENPDYAFNLAVGLEHLGQPKLALDYYRKALDLSFTKGRANFDQNLAIERVGRLSARVE